MVRIGKAVDLEVLYLGRRARTLTVDQRLG